MDAPRSRRGLAADLPVYLPASGRAMGWVDIRRLACPAGHHIRRDAFLLTDGAVRCKFREPGTGHECGRILYLLACVAARTPETEPTLYFVVEVTFDEIDRLQRGRLGVLDALAQLGAAMPSVREGR